MTLPSPIVTYQKRTSAPPDPFGPWCKLHHAFLIHLAEARLSGASYKVAMQVLCASFYFGQYQPAAISLDQFQSSQRLGRKAVVEGLRQAVAKGILYQEEGWQAGAHTPKCYGLVFYRALAEDSDEEDHSFTHQGMTLLKGGVSSPSKRAFKPGNSRSTQASKRSSSIFEPDRKAEEEFRGTTGAEIKPVAGEQSPLKDTSRAEIEPAPVSQPNQKQCANRTTAGVLTEPETAQQHRLEAASHPTLDKEEKRDTQRTPASLVLPLEAAPKDRDSLEEEPVALFQQSLPPAGAAATLDPFLPGQQASKIATLREDYQRRQAELEAWHPHGVEQIQAKIAARLEARRLERQIEELETACTLQDQRTQEMETICAVGQPDAVGWHIADDMSAPERATVPLQVSQEQLALWRAEVAAQRQVVVRVKTQYQAVTEQLQHCYIGRGNWGALVREQRFLAGEVEEQEAKLARNKRFVALIEAGATKEEARAQLLGGHTPELSAEEMVPEDLPPAAIPTEEQLPAEPAPRLEGQKLRQALFTTLAQMFTTGDPRHIALERGKFNRAIKNFVLADVQPEEVSLLKATYERLWPKITCTVMGVANHLPLLIEETRKLGYWVGAPPEERSEARGGCHA